MLTQEEREWFEQHGLPAPSRLRALNAALRAESRDARAASARANDRGDTHRAAMLGGKSKALAEAAEMLQVILRGDALHPRSYSSAKARAKAYAERKAARLEARMHLVTVQEDVVVRCTCVLGRDHGADAMEEP